MTLAELKAQVEPGELPPTPIAEATLARYVTGLPAPSLSLLSDGTIYAQWRREDRICILLVFGDGKARVYRAQVVDGRPEDEATVNNLRPRDMAHWVHWVLAE